MVLKLVSFEIINNRVWDDTRQLFRNKIHYTRLNLSIWFDNIYAKEDFIHTFHIH